MNKEKKNKRIFFLLIAGVFVVLISSLIIVSKIQANKDEVLSEEEFLDDFDVNDLEVEFEEDIDDLDLDDFDINNLLDDEIDLSVGSVAPDFNVETLSGDKFKLSELKGKKVMLNFWATWCPPCREEMPDLQKLSEKNGDIEVVAVNLTSQENDVGTVEKFVDEHKLDFTIPLDTDSKVMEQYNIMPIPTSFLIDTDGKIGLVMYGPMKYKQMVEEMEKIK